MIFWNLSFLVMFCDLKNLDLIHFLARLCFKINRLRSRLSGFIFITFGVRRFSQAGF